MTLTNTQTRYGSLSIALHWLMLILLAAVYACIEFRGLFPKDSAERDLMKTLHFMLGLTVFTLVWLRLLLKVTRPTPRIEPKPPAWQTGLAHLMHWALYLFMISMPILGWLITSAEGHQVMFYGFDLPLLVALCLLMLASLNDYDQQQVMKEIEYVTRYPSTTYSTKHSLNPFRRIYRTRYPFRSYHYLIEYRTAANGQVVIDEIFLSY